MTIISQTELNINYTSLVTLAQLFVPHLKAKAAEGKQATLVTVTSGLAFVPMPATALYCATKAAVRSYTISCLISSYKLQQVDQRHTGFDSFCVRATSKSSRSLRRLSSRSYMINKVAS